MCAEEARFAEEPSSTSAFRPKAALLSAAALPTTNKSRHSALLNKRDRAVHCFGGGNRDACAQPRCRKSAVVQRALCGSEIAYPDGYHRHVGIALAPVKVVRIASERTECGL